MHAAALAIGSTERTPTADDATDPVIGGRWWSGYVSLRSLRLAANLGPIRQVDFGWSTTRPFHWLPIRIVGDGRRPLVPLGHHLQHRRSQSECQAGQISSDGEPFDQGDSVNSP